MGQKKVNVLRLCWRDILFSSLRLAVRSKTYHNIKVHHQVVVDVTRQLFYELEGWHYHL